MNLKWLIVILITLIPLKAQASQIDSGFVIGAFAGLIAANWDKPMDRDHVLIESMVGLSVGGLMGAGVGVAAGENWNTTQWGEFVKLSAFTGSGIGAGKAIIKREKFFKSTWDGFSLGAMAPGALIGGGIGLGMRSGVAMIRGQKMVSEPSLVGYGSAGVLVGGSLNYLWAGATLGGVVGATITGINLVTTTTDGIAYSRVLSGPDDAVLHYEVSGHLADQHGKGPALLVGAGKEARDYFLNAGNAEWRDLKNDWRGVFRIHEN